MQKTSMLPVLFVFLSSLLFAPIHTHAAPPDVDKQRREFLFALGFEDYSTELQRLLDEHAYPHELARRQMEANRIAYQAVNASRELAILVAAEIGLSASTMYNERFAKLARLTAKILAMEPLSPPTVYPSEILGIANERERHIAMANWLRKDRKARMEEHKNGLLSDLVEVVYEGKINADPNFGNKEKIKRMDRMLTTIIERMYLDDTTGANKYLGRALAALLLREESLGGNGSNKMWKQISAELEGSYHLYLENYIGDTLVFDTPGGKETYKVVNGTMVLTRYLANGSLQISYAAVPKPYLTMWKARLKKIIGTPFASKFYISGEDVSDGITFQERVKDWVAQSGWLREGFSHIGYGQVLRHEGTGISITRILDNYPSRVFDTTGKYVHTGGVRIGFPEQFINRSHHSAVYMTTPDPVKFQAWAREFVAKNGYKSEFFPSKAVELEGIVPVDNQNIRTWKTEISEAEWTQLHQIANAAEFSAEAWKRFTDILVKMMLRGVIFHWPDPYNFYLENATYCSQLGEMGMLQAIGVPLEQTKSTWHWLLKTLAAVGRDAGFLKKLGLNKLGDKILGLEMVQKAMKTTQIPIISPTSLALQPYNKGRTIKFRGNTLETRAQRGYYPDAYRANSRLIQQLQQALDLTRPGEGVANYPLDYGAAMAELDYAQVLRGAREIPTQGLSEEVFAEIGTEKGAARLGSPDPNFCNNANKQQPGK